jgi:sulfoxide reductase heme-binding subunit YedZ
MRIELDDAFVHFTGSWALYFLYLTLCVTPLRQLTGQVALVRFRRTLGLTAFLYALLHFYSYAWLEMGLDPAAIVADIQRRPAAIMGAAALALLIPMALTASNVAIRRLGIKRWQAIHKAVYLIVVLVVLHMLLVRLGQGELAEVAINAAIVTFLLGWRLVAWLRSRRTQDLPIVDKQRQVAPEVYALLEAIDRRSNGMRMEGTDVGRMV